MEFGLIDGFILALSPTTLLWAFIGCFLGTVVGVLPGLGPAATMAMLLPIASNLDPTNGMVAFCAIYYGAMYGGSTTSILVNVPGEASSLVTCLDGYPMTKQGRAGEALAISAIGSFIAGTCGVLMLSVVAYPLANFSLRFGPPEYLCLVTFSMSAMITFSGRNLVKGLIAGTGGMLVASAGLDPMTGMDRFVFGIPVFMRGFDIIAVCMGLFGVGEVLVSGQQGITSLYQGALGHLIPRGVELKKGLLASFRGTAIGLGLGLLPGMISSVVSFITYDIEKRISKYPWLFGKGCIEGVAAPEASNNAVAAAGFVPMMSFGIPTTPVFAIVLALFMVHGLQPGPRLFMEHSDMAWTIIASFYIGNIILLILNLPLVGLWARLASVPYVYLGPFILAVTVVGAYSVRNTMFDVWTMMLFGLIGYAMKSRDWPLAPMILGIILGPMFEVNLRQTLQMYDGTATFLFARPIALSFLGLTLLMVMISRKLYKSTPDEFKEA